jgi:hypothetical protein
MNKIMICYCCSQIFEFLYIFKGFISYHYIMTGAGLAQSAWWLGYGLDDWGLNVSRGGEGTIFSLPPYPD